MGIYKVALPLRTVGGVERNAALIHLSLRQVHTQNNLDALAPMGVVVYRKVKFHAFLLFGFLEIVSGGRSGFSLAADSLSQR